MLPTDTGARGQQAAEDYLRRRGLKILDRNWACPDGKISIVADDNGTLVACAIITSTGRHHQAPLDRAAQRLRSPMRRAAIGWLNAHGRRSDTIRVDLIGLLLQGSGGFTIEHVRGVG